MREMMRVAIAGGLTLALLMGCGGKDEGQDKGAGAAPGNKIAGATYDGWFVEAAKAQARAKELGVPILANFTGKDW